MTPLLANTIWFLSALPDYCAFRLLLHFPKAAQKSTQARRRREDGTTIHGHEPTSGSTGATKWIPYTPCLKREFLRGINPWIVSLYLKHPGLFFRTHYWSISPSVPFHPPEGIRPKDNANSDRSYLTPLQAILSQALFRVPESVGRISDPSEHARATLLPLLADRSLGLISVWHPSFFLILLEYATDHADNLADDLASGMWAEKQKKSPLPERAEQVRTHLKTKTYASLWPSLKVISCWDQARAKTDAARLRALFPLTEVQGKGLLATEGIVTIPWKSRRQVLAIRSHTYRFRKYDVETDSDSGDLTGAHAVEAGMLYTVYLTTGNGSTDYPLGDVVRCTGFEKKTPCFEFCYRRGGVSDLHGEKLHAAHLETVLQELEREYAPENRGFSFAMLIPEPDKRGYVLVYDGPKDGPKSTVFAEVLESRLNENIYYRDARFKGQLRAVTVRRVEGAMHCYRESLSAVNGSIKNPPLYPLGDESRWRTLLDSLGICDEKKPSP